MHNRSLYWSKSRTKYLASDVVSEPELELEPRALEPASDVHSELASESAREQVRNNAGS
jgi:hypothetical protein